jgi:hypothetical protein
MVRRLDTFCVEFQGPMSIASVSKSNQPGNSVKTSAEITQISAERRQATVTPPISFAVQS